MNKREASQKEAYKKYIDSLPKKRMGAGVIIRNTRNDILMLTPSYKSVLEIPGGVVEKNESPYQACKREGNKGKDGNEGLPSKAGRSSALK